MPVSGSENAITICETGNVLEFVAFPSVFLLFSPLPPVFNCYSRLCRSLDFFYRIAKWNVGLWVSVESLGLGSEFC